MKTQKGFGVVAVFFIIVLVILIGLVGYYVSTPSQESSSTSDMNTSSNTENTQQPQQSTLLKEGYALYEDNDIALQYPEKWSVDETRKKTSNRINFESPDYKTPGPDYEGYTEILEGYLLKVHIREPHEGESYERKLDLTSRGQKAHGGHYETLKIDGKKAILSDIKAHGSYMEATTYGDDYVYAFRLTSQEAGEPEFKKFFESILETVEIK